MQYTQSLGSVFSPLNWLAHLNHSMGLWIKGSWTGPPPSRSMVLPDEGGLGVHCLCNWDNVAQRQHFGLLEVLVHQGFTPCQLAQEWVS